MLSNWILIVFPDCSVLDADSTLLAVTGADVVTTPVVDAGFKLVLVRWEGTSQRINWTYQEMMPAAKC